MITIKRLQPGDDLSLAFDVRDRVFTIEQGFSPDIEVDEKDPVAHHVLMFKEGIPFATARVFPKEAGSTTYIIGRVCILKEYRGNGTGLELMVAAETYARELGATSFELGAQVQAGEFYRKAGFVETEERYFEEHCEHVTMVKRE